MRGEQRPVWGMLYLWSGLIFSTLGAEHWLPLSHCQHKPPQNLCTARLGEAGCPLVSTESWRIGTLGRTAGALTKNE